MEERIHVLWFTSGQLKPFVYTILSLVNLPLLGTGKRANAKLKKNMIVNLFVQLTRAIKS